MAEMTVRRVVIACDAACNIVLAVRSAAALAARWNATLHGVFLEDENLYRLAALPFGRQVTLSSPVVSEKISAADLEKLSPAMGAAMRRALAEAAAERGIAWSFGIVRDLPTMAALSGIDADLLVVESVSRPFAGSWRPPSAWGKLTGESARTVLIRRQAHDGQGPVLVLTGSSARRDRLLASAVTVADPGDDIVVLVGDGSPSAIDAATEAAKRLTTPQRRSFRLEAAPTDMAGLLRRIDRLQPGLIVVDAGEANGDAVRDLLIGTSCDVLLVR